MSIIKHVTLQTIVAHDFRYDLRTYVCIFTHNQLIALMQLVGNKIIKIVKKEVNMYMQLGHHNGISLFPSTTSTSSLTDGL